MESLQVAATRSGLGVFRTMQLLQRRHRAGWKFCGSRGVEYMCWQRANGLNDFTLAPDCKQAWTCNTERHDTENKKIGKIWKNYSIRLSDQKLFLLQNLDAWIYSEDVHWWNSTKGDQNFLTDIWDSKIHKQRLPPGARWCHRLFPSDPLQRPPGHAARGDRADGPGRDTVAGGAWQWVATRDPGWWHTLGPCDRITWSLPYFNVGWAYPTRMSLNPV